MRAAAVLLLVLPVLAASPSPVAPQVAVAPPPAAPVVEGLEAAWTVVRDGSEVRVHYNVDGGQNVVTQLQVIR